MIKKMMKKMKNQLTFLFHLPKSNKKLNNKMKNSNNWKLNNNKLEKLNH